MTDEYDKLRRAQLPWTDKYKPLKVNDVLLPPYLLNKFITCIRTNNIPNLILSGQAGVGKSSVIKCLAHELYNSKYDNAVLELNATDDKGIKIVQNDIVTFCNIRYEYGKHPSHKLIIIDDIDNMMDKSQLQISILMEKFKHKARFVFTCNSTYDIVEAIQCRCIILCFTTLGNQYIIKKLTNICEKEKITFEKTALLQIAKISQGDMRIAINMLQLLYVKNNCIKNSHINLICTVPQPLIIKVIFDLCINKNICEAIKKTLELKNSGYSGTDIVLGMIQTIKSNLCLEISQDDKIRFLNKICNASYCISKSVDSDLQLVSCISELCR
jgi:replication factor C subunit 2/4